jgi:hypothetical protein
MQSEVKIRVDKEEENQIETDIFENLNVDVSTKFTFQVKVGNKFATKNTPAEIKKTGKRYKIQDNPFYFFKEAEAYDAARILGGKVFKQ